MREILFHGKRKDNGEWVEGSYCHAEKLDRNGDEHYIIDYAASGSSHEVYPETVGQYTGLTDKNGKKVFEGDIVEVPYAKSPFKIKYIESRARFLGINNKEELMSMLGSYRDFEVIGNIHDKPELLQIEG